ARRADRGDQPDADQRPHRPAAPRQCRVAGDAAGDRAQYARHHESGTAPLLHVARRDAGHRHARGGAQRPACPGGLSWRAMMTGRDSETGQDGGTPPISGYGFGKVDTIVTVEDVAREAVLLSDTAPSRAEIAALAAGP